MINIIQQISQVVGQRDGVYHPIYKKVSNGFDGPSFTLDFTDSTEFFELKLSHRPGNVKNI